MQKFRKHTGKVSPLDRANVDTDQIIPQTVPEADREDRLWGISVLRLASVCLRPT